LDQLSLNEGQVAAQVSSTNGEFDWDRDGVIDEDELLVSHTDPKVPDTDRDGMWDGAELRAGTDPMDEKSYLGITGAKRESDGSLTLTFMSVIGRFYQLEHCVDALGGQWKAVGQVVPATGPSQTIRDITASAAGTRFYRVRLVE
jgi:hypothetical protein